MKRAHVTRATIANADPEELAQRVSERNAMFRGLEINATIHASIGVSKWGIEHGATLETTAQWGSFAFFLLGILEDLAEDAAYITQDGAQAFLLWEDGRLEEL